ncbi:hypothetical protein V6N13_065363 [Hibiscus sabdariffa]
MSKRGGNATEKEEGRFLLLHTKKGITYRDRQWTCYREEINYNSLNMSERAWKKEKWWVSSKIQLSRVKLFYR